MDDSALQAQLAGFSSHRHFLEGWLQFWTWLVVIGVACELLFIIWDHREEWKVWVHAQASGVIPFPSKPSLLKLIFEILSVVFVVAGVSGELVIDSKLGTLETNVQNVNGQRVSQLQNAASHANERAAKLEQENITLSANVTTLQGDVAKAKTEQERLGIELAGAQKEVEDERSANLKLEADIAPRRLTPAQQTAIAIRCGSLRFVTVSVTSYAMDVESAILGKQIIDALNAAKLHGARLAVEDDTAAVVSMGGFALGIHLSGTDPTAVDVIRLALSDDGKLTVAPLGSPTGGGAAISTRHGSDRSGVEILIGIKPIQ